MRGRAPPVESCARSSALLARSLRVPTPYTRASESETGSQVERRPTSGAEEKEKEDEEEGEEEEEKKKEEGRM